MITYRPLNLNELINLLNKMPRGARLVGIQNSIDSYRGYYEHVAISPDSDTRETTAASLAEYLSERIGDPMTGWKGGDYTIKGECYVFVAPVGDCGPALAGFTDKGEPITVEDVYF